VIPRQSRELGTIDIVAYLRSRGWVQHTADPAAPVSVWQSAVDGEGFELLVPRHKNWRDYERRVSEVLSILSDAERRPAEVIAHDIAVVERISHRVAVMYLGEIVEIGPRDAVINAPQHPYTKRLMRAVPVPDPAMRHRPIALSSDEIQSAVRGQDYAAPATTLVEAGPGHFVRVPA